MTRDTVSYGGDPELAQLVDRICDSFAAAWQSSEPRLEDYIAQGPESARPVLFRELLMLELEHCSKSGSLPPWGLHFRSCSSIRFFRK